MKYDYSAVRRSLSQAIGLMESARDAAGRVNLPPTMTPGDVRRQVDDLEAILDEAKAEVEAARADCARLARTGLAVVG